MKRIREMKEGRKKQKREREREGWKMREKEREKGKATVNGEKKWTMEL